MSSRFGRNKRRAMRERLAATEAMLYDTAGKLRDAQTHARYLEGVISRAKEIAGEMSVLFPANTLKAHEKTSHVTAPEYVPDQVYGDCGIGTFRLLELPVILAHVDASALRSNIHFQVEFDGGFLGYAVTRSTLYAVPESRLAHDIAKHLTRILAAEIAGAKRTMKGQRQ